ncbi:MAG: Fur family transcriptional regulator [Proteobacteria bacterium]|nr:Fur family transcriptional regulator [Pseudomonadota bacterium]MCZ6783917.1 Fur family transcriptional regulator [Pseudomonadota bacterium]
MPHSVEEIEARLRANGLSLTPQRRAIVRHLLGSANHPTAAQVLEGITREFPMASRATVYTTLALLRDLEVVSEVPGPGNELRFDPNPDPHQHFCCTRCGRLEDVPDECFPVSVASDRRLPFQVSRFRIVAEGLCADCS